MTDAKERKEIEGILSAKNYKIIDKYTDGNYELIEAYPNHESDYDDGTPADVFFFEN